MDDPATISHQIRVYKELRDAGASKHGAHTQEARYLHKIIHRNEHIGAVVYGYSEGGFILLAATDKRIIYLDNKPLFTTVDELSYDAVTGVKLVNVGLFAGVTLHTRVAEFSVRWVNVACAQQFVHYIETRRLEQSNTSQALDTPRINT